MSRSQPGKISQARRRFLKSSGVVGLGVLGGQLPLVARPVIAMTGGADYFGPLEGPDGHGLMLPAGFTSRIVGPLPPFE